MNAQLVAIMARATALQAHVEGLKADNAIALACGEKPPCDSSMFISLATSLYQLAREAEALKQVNSPPQPVQKLQERLTGCPVCSIPGNAAGYVCSRSDCPIKVTS